MKEIIKLSFFLAFSCYSFSQDLKGVIQYSKRSIPSALNKDLKKEEPIMYQKFMKMESMISEAEKKVVFELSFHKNESYFRAKPAIELEGNRMNRKMGLGPLGASEYYNDDKNRLMQLNAYGELFLISKPKLKWEIQKEGKKIGKYDCLKATTEITVNSKGRKHIITAWFTPKITVSLGPLGYSGLPGLILELEVHKKIYYVKKITLNPKEEIKIKKPTKGVKLTEKEFQETASSMMQKFKKSKGY